MFITRQSACLLRHRLSPLACSIAALGVCVAFLTNAYSASLWHQGVYLGGGTAIADQEFPDFDPASIYIVSDVTFDTAVRIDEISVPFTDQSGDWPTGSANAILNIFPVDTSLDTEDATLGKRVPVTIGPHDFFVFNEVTATDLSIKLHSGSYWIGLTPILENSIYGQEFHLRANTAIGQPSHVSNPGGHFDHSATWIPVSDLGGGDAQDMAISISGSVIDAADVPEPSLALSLLLLQGACAIRRRRAK